MRGLGWTAAATDGGDGWRWRGMSMVVGGEVD